MLNLRALTVALLAILLVLPFAAQAAAPIIRTKSGVHYELPAGWDWGGANGYGVTLQHQGTTVDGKSPNKFELRTGNDYGEDYSNGWDSVDVDEQRAYPSGVQAHWKVGPRYGMHYAFLGEATVGGKVLRLTILDNRTPTKDMKLVAAAFESAAQSLKSVAESTSIYHPTLGIAAGPLEQKFWYNNSGPRNIAYLCWNNGRTGDTTIYAYPSGFKDAGKALADITGHFEKAASLKIGKIQRAAVPGGETLWTEQPGSQWPFLAAVRRDGQVFFISVNAVTAAGCTRPASSADVLTIARSLRGWDGK